ncbi:hypothetical protein NDU88_006061 [Pleurodeles waltl]|uniref:Uncharacterized protein n=1 Tax=Pleurodeles waltl TaxID=8319 RepID=A0AAV7QH07_PLEWA|nr:hypothetical protein NDU88_006061 [Pleurodeles waltl]
MRAVSELWFLRNPDWEMTSVLLSSKKRDVDFGVLPALQTGGGLEGAIDDHTELGGDDGARFVEDMVGAGVGGRSGVDGAHGFDVVLVIDVGPGQQDFGVARCVGVEPFAVVGVVVDAVFVEGSFGGPDELVVLADGCLEDGVVALCWFVAPLLLDFSALLLRGLKVGGEPDGLGTSAVVWGFPEWSQGVSAVV